MPFVKGPIFANVILADEINRTPPKTQAALLEAMQEHQVTAAGVSATRWNEPFFVLATQNPIEMEGTYPLPEAQLDRFMFNVVDRLPARRRRGGRSCRRTTARSRPPDRAAVHRARTCSRFHEVVRGGARRRGRRPLRRAPGRGRAGRGRPGTPEFVNEWVSWGAGLRAAQFLVLGAKARALLAGRFHVTPDDIRALAHAGAAPPRPPQLPGRGRGRDRRDARSAG